MSCLPSPLVWKSGGGYPGLVPAAGISSVPPQGLAQCRLTLTQGTAVTTSDVTGATSVYLEPYNGDQLALYDGSSTWTPLTVAPSTISLALGTLTSGLCYDVFAYNNSGTITLEKLAWTSTTARATALVLQNGVWVKSGATTRRFLGTFYTTSTTTTADAGGAGTTQVGGQRFLWNAQNRVLKSMYVTDTTSQVFYSTAAWAQYNSASGNKCEYVCGLASEIVAAWISGCPYNGTSPNNADVGLGVDSTSTNSAQAGGGGGSGGNGVNQITSRYSGNPGIGYHALNWLYYGNTAGMSWLGHLNQVTFNPGMVVDVWC